MNTAWTRRGWMSDRRDFPRYRVDGLEGLRGYLHFGKHLRKRLCTFGQGGCGFYVDYNPENSDLLERLLEFFAIQVQDRVLISFEFDGLQPQSVEVSGTIRYSIKVDDDDPSSPWYFGIEFDEACRSKVESIVEHLDFLAERCLIEEE